jgi:hypothetical protein
MGARAKAFFSVSAIGLIVFCFWLWGFMPTQGWAEIDFQGGKWNLVAAGWSTLLHAWPILGAGVMLGLGLGIGLLGMLFRSLLDADQKSEIEHLERLVRESREREQQSLVLARKELEQEFSKARDLYDRAVDLQVQLTVTAVQTNQSRKLLLQIRVQKKQLKKRQKHRPQKKLQQKSLLKTRRRLKKNLKTVAK